MLPRELCVKFIRVAVQQCPSGLARSTHCTCQFTQDAVRGYSLPYTSCLPYHGREGKTFLKNFVAILDICQSAMARLLIMHRIFQELNLIGVACRVRARDVPRLVQQVYALYHRSV